MLSLQHQDHHRRVAPLASFSLGPSLAVQQQTMMLILWMPRIQVVTASPPSAARWVLAVAAVLVVQKTAVAAA